MTVPIAPLPPTPVSPGAPAPLAPRTTTTTAPPGGGTGDGGSRGPICRDSTDPACGDFYWDPPPGANDPLAISVSQSDVPFFGREITFTITVSDGDASLFSACNATIVDGTNVREVTGLCGGPPPCTVRYGPWTPPAEEGASYQFVVTHRFVSLGPYQITVTARSHNPGCGPYDSEGRYG